jgi:hypothetical protein
MIGCRGIAGVLGVAAWAATIATMSLSASEPAGKPAVAAQDPAACLLILGDRYSPSALAMARTYRDGLRAKAGNDARVRYAFALVLIRQRCEQEAAELLGPIVAQQPDALHLWRAKIWAEMAAHKDREALADVRSVADVLKKQRPAEMPAADREAWRATSAFLGRVFGFLDVPRPDALPTDEVRRAKQCLLTALGDQRTEFEQNEELVVGKFSKAREGFEEQRAKRVAAAKTRQDEIGEQKKLIDQAETSVDFDTEKVKSNTKTEIDRLNQAAEMVNKNILTCQFRLNGLRQAIQLNQAKLEIQTKNIASFKGSTMLALPQETTQDNPIVGDSLVPQLVTQNQLIELLTRLTAEQAVLTRQVTQLTEELRTTLAQRDALLELGDQSTAGLKAQAASLKRDGKKLERAQQGEAKKIAAERRKTLLTKQTSFATFEPFPFETEKQRVLGARDP